VTTLVNSFEGGTTGTTISTGNSGPGSGNAFDAVSAPGGGGTLAFSNAEAAHGSLACDLATTGTTGTPYVAWTTSMGSQAQVWFRLYLYFTANPSATQRVFAALQGGTACATIAVGTSGKLQFLNAAGSAIFTQTGTIPLNQWFRIEGFIIGSATVGQVELKRFNSPDSTVASETNTSAASQNTTGAMDTYRFGHGAGSALANLGPWWQDDIGLSNGGYLGPVIPPVAVPAVAPPGFLSPAAFSFPHGPWPGPANSPVTFRAVSASHGVMTRSTGKLVPASPVPAGKLKKSAAKKLAAAPSAAGKLPRSAGKILVAATHPAGALAKVPRKLLGSTVTAKGALRKTIPRLLAATAATAAKVLRSAGKRLTATPRSAATLARSTAKPLSARAAAAAGLIRGRAKTLAARVATLARLIAQSPAPSFKIGIPQTEWHVSITAIGISQLSTQYILIPVAAARNGNAYNPTADTVQFAFMPQATQVPGSGNWVAGVWETDSSNLIYPYGAKCLVGPAGITNPGIGTYVIYIKITDNPEIPVLIAGQLQIS